MPSKQDMNDDRAFQRAALKIWKSLNSLSEYLEDEVMGLGTVKEIRIQGPAATGDGYRAIVKVRAGDGGAFISFHNAGNLADLLVTLNDRMDNATMKWKEDLPYDQRIVVRKGKGQDAS